MPKPKIPNVDTRTYFETNKLDEVNEMVRQGEWDLVRIEIEVGSRIAKTFILGSRQSA